MKLLAATLVAATGLLAAPAYAQTTPPDRSEQARKADEAGLRKKRKASAGDIARMQQRMSMNPDEAKRDQQMEILEARAGGGTANTSFGRSSGPSRQYEKGNGGFTVSKFKDNRIGTARQKRGQTRAAGFVDPKGKPLKHKKKKHGFLFFA